MREFIRDLASKKERPHRLYNMMRPSGLKTAQATMTFASGSSLLHSALSAVWNYGCLGTFASIRALKVCIRR